MDQSKHNWDFRICECLFNLRLATLFALRIHCPDSIFSDYQTFTFTTPDTKNFRNLALSFEALNKGGNLACVLNAANEVSVKAFLDEKISFLDIATINERVMEKISFVKNPELNDYIESDRAARFYAEEMVSESC